MLGSWDMMKNPGRNGASRGEADLEPFHTGMQVRYNYSEANVARCLHAAQQMGWYLHVEEVVDTSEIKERQGSV